MAQVVKPDPVIRVGNKKFLLTSIRQSLIMMIGAIEDYLDMERSIVPRHKRPQVDGAQRLDNA